MNTKSIRNDWQLIESLIQENAKVLDIGCGEGGLINQLESNIMADTRGIEIDPKLARKAIASGHNVVEGNAEKDLNQFSNQSFDYVILSQTLQAMIRPKEMLIELLRIGNKAIVSFPNFGHWRIRSQLMLKGKMPVTNNLPYSWYDTPNLHMCTIKDLFNFCDEKNIKIIKVVGVNENNTSLIKKSNLELKNLFSKLGIFLIS